jgi:hypothetical protein
MKYMGKGISRQSTGGCVEFIICPDYLGKITLRPLERI